MGKAERPKRGDRVSQSRRLAATYKPGFIIDALSWERNHDVGLA